MNPKIPFLSSAILSLGLLAFSPSFAGSESHGGHVVVTFASAQDREKVEKVLEKNEKEGRHEDPLDGIDLKTLKVESLDLFLERKRGLPNHASDVITLEDLPTPKADMSFVSLAESRIELMKGKTDFYDSWMKAFQKTVGDARRWVGSESGVTITKDSGLGSGEGSALFLSKVRLALNIAVQNEIQIIYDERLMQRAGLIDASAVVNHETGWAYSEALGLKTSVPIQKFVGLMYEKTFAELSGVAIAAEVARLGLLKPGTVETIFSGGQPGPTGWVGGDYRNIFREGQTVSGLENIVVGSETFSSRRVFTHEKREPDSRIVRHENGKISTFFPESLDGAPLRIQGFPVKSGTEVRFNDREELLVFTSSDRIRFKNAEVPEDIVVEFSDRPEKNLHSLACNEYSQETIQIGDLRCALGETTGPILFYENGGPQGCWLAAEAHFEGLACGGFVSFYKSGALKKCHTVRPSSQPLSVQDKKLRVEGEIDFFDTPSGQLGPAHKFTIAGDEKNLKLYDQHHKSIQIRPEHDRNRRVELDAEGWVISYTP